jgi:uncharacterized membrane protein YkvA (DUF1232 family)
MSREGFVDSVREGLVLLPQHVKLLLRVYDDPDVPESGRVLASGSLVHWLSAANTIPGVRGILAYVDDLLIMRLALARLGALAPEALARHRDDSPEVLDGLDAQVELIRGQLGGAIGVFETALDRIGDLKHMGRTATECVVDAEAGTMLYEEVQAALVNLDLEETAVVRELKGLDRALAGLQRRGG